MKNWTNTEPDETNRKAISGNNTEEITEGRDPKGKFIKGNKHGFKPGKSGNPAGRPRIRVLTVAYMKMLGEIDPEHPLGYSYAESIAERQIKVAASSAKGSTNAAKEIAERTEGKVRYTTSLDPAWLRKKSDYEQIVQQMFE